MNRPRHHERARAAIEAHTRQSLAVDHAVFTWSLADAVEVVLEHLDLPPHSTIALPAGAPDALHTAIRARHHRPLLVATDHASLGMCPDALRHALDDVHAVVAWHPAGNRHPPPVHDLLQHARVPVVDAGPTVPATHHQRIGSAVATCISLARPTHPAAVVATDDAALAALVAQRHLRAPDVAPAAPGASGAITTPAGARDDRAHLDRWAATVAATLSHRPLADPALARSYQLLVDVVAPMAGAHVVFGPVTGWGEPPTLLVAFPDRSALETGTALLGAIGALQVSQPGAVADRDTAVALDDTDPVHRLLSVQLTRALDDGEAHRLATAGGVGAPHDPTRAEHLHQPLRIRAAKRTFDVVVGAALLALSSPVMLAIALIVRLTEGQPVIFRQVRVGRHGQHFDMLKFRTMVVGADQLVDDYRTDNERHGPLFKLTDDPRATFVGRVLRRTSLDELPQLFNVVGGTMSLVGPRPALPTERRHFPPELRRRECVRPGITGLWQVEARDDASFERYAELDLAYLEGCSLRLDLSILGRTPDAVLTTALRRPSRSRRTTRGASPLAGGDHADAGADASGSQPDTTTPDLRSRARKIPGAVSRRRARRATQRSGPRSAHRR